MKNNQSGNILLWALVVVMITINTVLFLSDFIISSLQQGRLIQQSTKAWYLADAGIEHSLYRVRKLEIYNIDDVEIGDGEVLRSIVEEDDLIMDLDQDENYQLDLYDVEPGQEIVSLFIQGETTNAWIEAQTVSWQLGNQLPSDNVRQDLRGPTDIMNGFFLDLPTSIGYYHRVKLKTLYDDVSELSITAYSAGLVPVSIPGRVKVEVVGIYGKATQKISVTIPKRAPLYGLFDYVIFSERLVTK